jgi:dihydroorotase-like cyclic amidohydrolase
MNNVDLVITGGNLVSPNGIIQQAIAVDAGRIAKIGAPDQMPPARERIDATGLHVLPGAIDVHVHFREPGFSHKETWTSATQAAAVGGIRRLSILASTATSAKAISTS